MRGLTPEASGALSDWLIARGHGVGAVWCDRRQRSVVQGHEGEAQIAWALARAMSGRLRQVAAAHGRKAALVALVAVDWCWPGAVGQDMLAQAASAVHDGWDERAAFEARLFEVLLVPVAARGDRVTAEIVERDRSGLVVLRGAAEVPAWTRLAGVEPWMAEAGRVYAALVERCDSPGAPSTLGRVDGGRWGGGCATDGRLHRARLLAACRAALGDGEALSVRRPAVRGDAAVPEGRRFVARRAEGEMLPGRRPVLRRDLADAVLVGGASLAEVLGAHGWGRDGRPREDLCAALVVVLRDLADALGRRERPARADCA